MEKYGDKFQDHLIEQYKLYVEMADRVSARRAQTNRFYISLLSVLLALLSIVVTREVFNGILSVIFVAVGILGIALCFLWYVNIRAYRQLNSGKFKVIHEMEQRLPFPAYEREWEILGKGKESKKYLKLTRIEQCVPFALAIPYLLLLAYSLYMWA
ncbi:hypothetical protein DRO38_03190 [Candidatus Bathyarchaeota archaeon]|nr:MAG: hypothetical protein DRO38_03190 [Candidatus Bathyarchaeota archaeon]